MSNDNESMRQFEIVSFLFRFFATIFGLECINCQLQLYVVLIYLGFSITLG